MGQTARNISDGRKPGELLQVKLSSRRISAAMFVSALTSALNILYIINITEPVTP